MVSLSKYDLRLYFHYSRILCACERERCVCVCVCVWVCVCLCGERERVCGECRSGMFVVRERVCV